MLYKVRSTIEVVVASPLKKSQMKELHLLPFDFSCNQYGETLSSKIVIYRSCIRRYLCCMTRGSERFRSTILECPLFSLVFWSLPAFFFLLKWSKLFILHRNRLGFCYMYDKPFRSFFSGSIKIFKFGFLSIRHFIHQGCCFVTLILRYF